MYTMLQKRKPRAGGKKRQNAQIIIYPKTDRSVGRTTSKEKIAAKEEVFSIGTTSRTPVETL